MMLVWDSHEKHVTHLQSSVCFGRVWECACARSLYSWVHLCVVGRHLSAALVMSKSTDDKNSVPIYKWDCTQLQRVSLQGKTSRLSEGDASSFPHVSLVSPCPILQIMTIWTPWCSYINLILNNWPMCLLLVWKLTYVHKSHNSMQEMVLQWSWVQKMEYLGLMRIKGMGAQVKNTVSRRKDFLPHTSESAPMRGALMNDSKPWGKHQQWPLVMVNYMLASTLY